MEIRKEIIRPGTYTYIDPRTNKPEKLTVTPDTIKHFHKTGLDMLKAGLSVPVPIEHQPEAVPMTESERAAKQLKDNGGWVSGYEIGEIKQKSKEGKETVVKDVLFGKLDIQDESIVDKLPKTIRFTSPHINSFTDGNGKKWDSVISHVALTTRPRITNQEPFAHDMAAALSLVGSLSPKPITELKEGISLSKAGLLKSGKKTLPVYPLAFSLLSGIKLSEEEMKKVEEEEEKDEEKFDEEEMEEKEDMTPIEKAIDGHENSQSDVKIHEVICHMLQVLGFEPPQNMDKTTFERDIYETLMAKLIEVGAKVDGEEEEVPEIEEEEEKNPIVEEHPTMYASLEEVNKISDPKERKLAGMMFALQQENAKNKKKAEAVSLSIISEHKKARDERVAKLAKRLPAEKREKLKKLFEAEQAKLSLSDAGVVIDPMADALEIFESSLVDIPSLLKNDGKSFSEQSQPKDDGSMSAERRKELVEALAANSPLPPEQSVNLSHAGSAFAAEVAKYLKSTNGDQSAKFGN